MWWPDTKHPHTHNKYKFKIVMMKTQARDMAQQVRTLASTPDNPQNPRGGRRAPTSYTVGHVYPCHAHQSIIKQSIVIKIEIMIGPAYNSLTEESVCQTDTKWLIKNQGML